MTESWGRSKGWTAPQHLTHSMSFAIRSRSQGRRTRPEAPAPATRFGATALHSRRVLCGLPALETLTTAAQDWEGRGFNSNLPSEFRAAWMQAGLATMSRSCALRPKSNKVVAVAVSGGFKKTPALAISCGCSSSLGQDLRAHQPLFCLLSCSGLPGSHEGLMVNVLIDRGQGPDGRNLHLRQQSQACGFKIHLASSSLLQYFGVLPACSQARPAGALTEKDFWLPRISVT